MIAKIIMIVKINSNKYEIDYQSILIFLFNYWKVNESLKFKSNNNINLKVKSNVRRKSCSLRINYWAYRKWESTLLVQTIAISVSNLPFQEDYG